MAGSVLVCRWHLCCTGEGCAFPFSFVARAPRSVHGRPQVFSPRSISAALAVLLSPGSSCSGAPCGRGQGQGRRARGWTASAWLHAQGHSDRLAAGTGPGPAPRILHKSASALRNPGGYLAQSLGCPKHEILFFFLSLPKQEYGCFTLEQQAMPTPTPESENGGRGTSIWGHSTVICSKLWGKGRTLCSF